MAETQRHHTAEFKKNAVLARYAGKCGYHIGVGNLSLTSIKWNYEKAFHIHYLTCWNRKNFDLLEPVNEKTLEMLAKQCGVT